MPDSVKLIDNSVKDALLRYSTVELIRKLFPDVKMHGRSVMCNPLRGEKHPSLSVFRGYDGYPHWKDHTTGETGDNIDFFRKVFPEMGYVEAVDRMALLILGRSALTDVKPGSVIPFYSPLKRQRRAHVPVTEEPSALQIVLAKPFGQEDTPKELINYARERGISDEVSGRYLTYVRFINKNVEGRSELDPDSGLPILDKDGSVIKRDGVNDAVGLYNGIGGFSLRIPETDTTKGFKGSNASFMTVILSDGTAPVVSGIKLVGKGDGLVSFLFYDAISKTIRINETQAFTGVEPWAATFALPFIDGWTGRYVEGRDLKGIVSVLGCLNGPVNGAVDVVEGMFDGLSVIELERLSSGNTAPGRDIVILNSISNIHWAVPFLAMHGEVRSLLDNDMRSSAGQKAFDLMRQSVGEFAYRAGVCSHVFSDSGFFYPHKDVNDFLKAYKGFSAPIEKTVDAKERHPRTRKNNKTNGPSIN